MDPFWLLIALVCGFAARQVRLPPLVGFLLAGFVLHALGERGGAMLAAVADLGIQLLLFTIGLKLRVGELTAREVWTTSAVHMLLTALVVGATAFMLGLGGLVLFAGLQPAAAATVGFALSFSSTVFAVKILEERDEMSTRHGQVAIGILIIQDLIAVVYLMATTGSLPSPWAFLLVGLWWLRPVLNAAIDRSGHGEVLVLFGIAAAVAGGELFTIVGLKDGLGALVFGVLLSAHPKSVELSRSLLGLKDLLLLGFFLSIGLGGSPAPGELFSAILLLIVFLPFKMLLFFWLMLKFRLRARSAFLATLSLASFSEFGLIVAAEAVEVGWLGREWLACIAIELALSFVIASLLNTRAHDLYVRLEPGLQPLESARHLPGDGVQSSGDARILIVGMGRVGRGAYRAMQAIHGDTIVGADADRERIDRLASQGYRVISGDAEEYDFWKLMTRGQVELILLAMPNHRDALLAAKYLGGLGYNGMIGAVAKYPEEREALEKAGIHAAFDYYAEVGKGFADHVSQIAEQALSDRPAT